jgi:hypothetical protein
MTITRAIADTESLRLSRFAEKGLSWAAESVDGEESIRLLVKKARKGRLVASAQCMMFRECLL